MALKVKDILYIFSKKAQYFIVLLQEKKSIKVSVSLNFLVSLNWSTKLINIITKDKVVEEKLRKNVTKKKLWICEIHYLPSQLITHPTCKTLVPGSLPTEHLTQKSHATRLPTEHQSSVIVSEKRVSTH